ncbi:tetratricopeptide repeat protein [Saccharicrinis aurantiacus]|uniref:tetratricopeptide repeat protein n=1 Tax=Saccharicrinis aurantiacus TaxID=1849719 RepID=UPI0009500E39|nr:tetratricopeptide repeat protein [Saccharicrinis aurantiacus]
MQDFSQENHNQPNGEIERFESLIKQRSESYFDVHQIESIFDHYNENNMYEKAEIALDMGLRQHPDSTSLQLKYSTILIERCEYAASLRILDYLKKVEKTNSEVFLNIGIIHTHQKNRTLAIKNFEKALKLASGDELSDFVFEISFTLNQHGFFNESRNLLCYYKGKFPKQENILFELAYAYDKLNDFDKGVEVYNQLLNINPYSDTAWYNLGILYNKLDLYEKAIHAYNMTLAISPELSEAYYNKANSLAHLEKYQEALDSYTEHIILSLFTPLTYYYMGDCWENLGNLQLANRFYKLAAELDPEHIEALEALGRTSYENRDYKTSIEAFDQALNITPESSQLWLYLGKSHRKAKNKTEAKRCLKKALINRHEDTLNWIEMYQFLEESESDFDAITFLEKLLIKDHTNGALHYLAAIIYNKENDNKQSLAHLVMARQLLPDDLDLVLNKYPQLTNIPKIASYINK